MATMHPTWDALICIVCMSERGCSTGMYKMRVNVTRDDDVAYVQSDHNSDNEGERRIVCVKSPEDYLWTMSTCLPNDDRERLGNRHGNQEPSHDNDDRLLIEKMSVREKKTDMRERSEEFRDR